MANNDKDRLVDYAINRVLITNIIAFVLGLSLYAISTFVSVSTPIPPVVIAMFIGILSTYFLSDKYVKPLIEEWLDLQAKKNEKSYPSEDLEIQNLELLYSLMDLYKYNSASQLNLENPNFTPFPKRDINEKVKEFGKNKNSYEKAVSELLDAEDRQYLQAVAQTAVKKSLKINNGDDKYEDIVNSIYAYLRAWLILSIKYHKYLPVEPILEDSENIDSHIKAIKFVSNEVLEGKNKNLLLPTTLLHE